MKNEDEILESIKDSFDVKPNDYIYSWISPKQNTLVHMDQWKSSESGIAIFNRDKLHGLIHLRD